MCWELDYKYFAELQEAQEARARQQRRDGIIGELLNEANKHDDKTNSAGAPVKEIVPAK